MSEYRQARQVLAQGDGNSYPHGVISYEEYSSGPNKDRNPVCSAVLTWLDSRLQGGIGGNSTVIVSGQKIPGARACTESTTISAALGPNVLAKVSATPKTSRSAWWEKGPL